MEGYEPVYGDTDRMYQSHVRDGHTNYFCKQNAIRECKMDLGA